MHNIEQYTLNYITRYWNMYCDQLKQNDQVDIDYPDYKLNFK